MNCKYIYYMAGQRGKRSDPNYKQLSGLVRVEVFRKFKVKCAEMEIDLSSAIEEAALLWLQAKDTAQSPSVLSQPLTIAFLIEKFGTVAELSERSGLPEVAIYALKNGKYPENQDLIQLSGLFEHPDDKHLIGSEELVKIRDETFGNNLKDVTTES